MKSELSIKPSTVYSIVEALEIRFDTSLAISPDPIALSVRFEAELTGIQIMVESSDCTPGAFCADARKDILRVIRALQVRMIERAYQKALQGQTVKRSRSVPQPFYATAGAVS